MIEPQLSGEFATLIGWADKVRKLGVRANADTPTDAQAAVRFGAEGIGLCRTEHMFFDEDRIQAVREMILADDEKSAPRRARQAAADAARRFRRAVRDHGRPAGDRSACSIRRCTSSCRTARRRSPRWRRRWAPIRRSLPTAPASSPNSTRCSASAAAASPSPIRKSPRCRRAPSSRRRSRPAKRTGKPVVPEVMVPLIATKAEFDLVKARIDAMAQAVAKEKAPRSIIRSAR